MENPKIDELTTEAKALQIKLDDFDAKMKKLSADRAVISKQLRSITGRIVTIQLKQ